MIGKPKELRHISPKPPKASMRAGVCATAAHGKGNGLRVRSLLRGLGFRSLTLVDDMEKGSESPDIHVQPQIDRALTAC